MTTKSGEKVSSYTYVMCDDSATDSLPSKPYLDTMTEGAEEHGLPNEYIEELKKLPHNGYTGIVNPT